MNRDEYIFSPQLPPPRLTTCADLAYEKIAINNNVAYSNGLSQDQQLEPQLLSYNVSLVYSLKYWTRRN